MPKIDKEFARYALEGIEAAIEKMQRQAAALRRIVGSRGGSAAKGGSEASPIAGAGPGVPRGRTRRRKWTMSAEARKRISDAQKARWARQRRG
jgi:hypothetical protein